MKIKSLLNGAVLLVYLSACSCSMGQKVQSSSSTKKWNKEYQKGLQTLNRGDLAKAEIIFKNIIAKNGDYLNAHKELSTMYYRGNRFSEAVHHLQEIIRIDSTYTSKVFYTLGSACYYSGDYDCAIDNLTIYMTSHDTNDALVTKAENIMSKAGAALDIMKDTLTIALKKLPPTINSADSEYLPSLSLDGSTLIFTRRDRFGEDYYYSERRDSTWSQALPLVDLNTSNNEGSHSISANGDLIIITGCNWRHSVGGCDLYYAQLTKNGWTTPKNMGDLINTSSWESQPSLSSDGNALYFASSRPGGIGGSDIWVSVKNDKGLFGEPINVGEPINTTGQEFAPFIHADNRTLYFSSNGHPGLGDTDLFVVRKNHLDVWQKPDNLGYPLNTSDAEGALIVSTDGSSGYFAREESENEIRQTMNLYEFELPLSLRPTPTTYLSGEIRDIKTNELLNNIKVTIYNNHLDTLLFAYFTKDRSDFQVALTQGIDYGIRIEKEGYVFYSDRFDLLESRDKLNPQILNIFLEKINAETNQEHTSNSEPVILKNIFFDIDQYELLSNSYSELATLYNYLMKYPNLTIQINGHTDNTGDSDHNLQLSKNRAKSVYNFLLNKGVHSSRMTYKGYGSEVPIADNDTAEGRGLNRRTEFMVVR